MCALYFFFFFFFLYILINIIRNLNIFCINDHINEMLLLQKNKGQGINTVIVIPLCNSSMSEVFYVEGFSISLLLNCTMDLVPIWYPDRYWSKVFISTHVRDLEVKVTDIEFKCLSFC